MKHQSKCDILELLSHARALIALQFGCETWKRPSACNLMFSLMIYSWVCAAANSLTVYRLLLLISRLHFPHRHRHHTVGEAKGQTLRLEHSCTAGGVSLQQEAWCVCVCVCLMCMHACVTIEHVIRKSASHQKHGWGKYARTEETDPQHELSFWMISLISLQAE